jgi:formimidoylglutamate deiminase
MSRAWSRDKVSESLLSNARKLRKDATVAEEVLWECLRNRKLNGLKFRRQQPMEGFVLDFYCDQHKLGIEVDGSIHSLKEVQQYDEQRTKFLEEFGIKMIRFSNSEIVNKTDEVLGRIKEAVENLKHPSPLPLSPGRGVSEGRGEGTHYYHFNSLWHNQAWLSPAYVGVDDKGQVAYLSDKPPVEATSVEYINGIALPGFQNAHSHAFQYAMAGLAENHPVGTSDDFWSWREAMYQCALSVNPDEAEAIAAMLYAEMLRHGYTHVVEFHYLHHDKDGKPYANLAEMGERMVAAAKTAGINITLTPVFYQKGGFEIVPQLRQRRFISTTAEEYFHLLDDSATVVKDQSHARLAYSVHSLRAVNLEDIVQAYQQGPNDIPFHLHLAEQKKEVNDCMAYTKQRPAEWLLNNLPVNDRFHLVHSTHLNGAELHALAASKATVVLCPSTEGNLGDGIFRMKEYVQLGGNWCIGTDSHIGLNPLEEFRMIDYRQRLVTNLRNTFEGDSAAYLVDTEIKNGRMAMGLGSEKPFAIGQPFDAVVYNSSAPLLAVTSPERLMATIVYASDASMSLGTMVRGKWVVKNNQHIDSENIRKHFVKAIRGIKNR